PPWKRADVLYFVAESASPGTVETSIIATDNNNKPNIINSIYHLGARLGIATEERMAGAAIDFPPGGERRRVPHVLVDGADSIGVAGALDRVYVNIGAFGEEWLREHNPIVGLRKPIPFSIARAPKKLRVLAGDGVADADPRKVSRQGERADAAPQRARRGAVSDEGHKGPRPRKDRLRRKMCGVPLEQAAKRRRRPPARGLLEVVARRRLPDLGAPGSDEARLPRRQLSVHRRALPDHAAEDQRGARAAGQRDPRQDLAGVLLRGLQGDAVDR